MVGHTLQDCQSSVDRTVRQARSTSTVFDATQPTVIALLCVIAFLFVVYLILIIFLYRRFYVRADKISTDLSVNSKILQRTPSTETTSLSPNAVGQQQIAPLPYLQTKNVDSYWNELYSCPSETMNAKQLHSYLFIDLHSTSSETTPNDVRRSFANRMFTTVENRSQVPFCSTHQQRSYGPRFVMRERSLSTTHHGLPQLHQPTMDAQKNLFGLEDSESSNSSTSVFSRNFPSTKQNQVLQSIEEELHWFQMTSFSFGNDHIIVAPYKSSSGKAHRTVYRQNSVVL